MEGLADQVPLPAVEVAAPGPGVDEAVGGAEESALRIEGRMAQSERLTAHPAHHVAHERLLQQRLAAGGRVVGATAVAAPPRAVDGGARGQLREHVVGKAVSLAEAVEGGAFHQRLGAAPSLAAAGVEPAHPGEVGGDDVVSQAQAILAYKWMAPFSPRIWAHLVRIHVDRVVGQDGVGKLGVSSLRGPSELRSLPQQSPRPAVRLLVS